MAANNQQIRDLIMKFLRGSITDTEQLELDEWRKVNDENRMIFENLTSTDIVTQELQVMKQYDREGGWHKVKEQYDFAKEAIDGERSNRFNWKRVAVAASIVGILFVAGYWFLNSPSTSLKTDESPSTITQGDVAAPDKNRAQIKLADGTIVYLDSAGNGELAMQGNVKLVKNANGEIVYETADDGPQTTVQYNTLFNPRGSKVQPLVLDDGTKVWLNAESSITYPTAFVGNERRVEISGEAYFEVAKDAGKKFFVTGAGVTTEVLGTHFNVNTFKDDGVVRVTLLEGRVRVKSGVPDKSELGLSGESLVIKPGEQVVSMVNGQLSKNKSVDVEQVMAWKNGQFLFGAGMSVEEIMRQVARWYDIEVIYEKNKNIQLGGSVSRNVNISEVLKILSLTGVVKFEVVGKKVIVK